MKYFFNSILITIISIGAVIFAEFYVTQSWEQTLRALMLVGILAILEISLSFDNAVVNALILKKMTPIWRKRFLLWGILIAVFGMRLFLPLLIVSISGGMGMIEAVQLSFSDPKKYAEIMLATHHSVAAFGGIFLFMVTLKYFINDEKLNHWISFIEVPLKKLAKLNSIEIGLSLGVILVISHFLEDHAQSNFLISGLFGLLVFISVDALGAILERWGQDSQDVNKASVGMFLYLEVLDASFSFDGVVGAFAITTNFILIMVGLSIGAFFVRSLTIYFVEEGILDGLKFLEHGAFYAIGVLSAIMLSQIFIEIPEWFTGGMSAVLIVTATLHSLWIRKQAKTVA